MESTGSKSKYLAAWRPEEPTGTSSVFNPLESDESENTGNHIATLIRQRNFDALTKMSKDLEMVDIDVSGCGLDETDMCALARWLTGAPGKIRLNLSGNPITDAGASAISEPLAAGRNVVHLNISSTSLSEVALVALCKSLNGGALEILDLSSNMVGQRAAIKLALALQRDGALRVLHIAHCNISRPGMRMVASGLGKNSTLTELNVGFNRNSGAVEYIAKALPSNHGLLSLDLSGTAVSAEEASDMAQALRQHRSLARLSLAHCSLAPAGISIICQALTETAGSPLAFLDLSFCGIGDSAAEAIEQMLQTSPQIVSIHLAGNDIPNSISRRIDDAIKVNRFKSEAPWGLHLLLSHCGHNTPFELSKMIVGYFPLGSEGATSVQSLRDMARYASLLAV